MRVPFHFVLVALGLVPVGCLPLQHQLPLQDQYQLAASMPAFEINREGHRSKEWRQEFPLGDGVSVEITGNGNFEGHVTAKYSDEAEPRSIYKRTDYFVVQEIRRSSTGDILYVAMAVPGNHTKMPPRVLAFDLRKRELIGEESATWLSSGSPEREVGMSPDPKSDDKPQAPSANAEVNPVPAVGASTTP